MALDTLGSIATHIAELFDNIPAGVSGNLVEMVDMSRIHVENFTGTNIGSNSISEQFQAAITNYAKADVIDLINAQAGGDNVKLAELSVSSTSEQMSAEQLRNLAEKQLGAIGMQVQVGKTLV